MKTFNQYFDEKLSNNILMKTFKQYFDEKLSNNILTKIFKQYFDEKLSNNILTKIFKQYFDQRPEKASFSEAEGAFQWQRAICGLGVRHGVIYYRSHAHNRILF